MIEKEKKHYKMRCDKCGNYLDLAFNADNLDELLAAASKMNWYGGIITGNMIQIGSVFNPGCKDLHYCSIKCARSHSLEEYAKQQLQEINKKRKK